jgi:hypothetical protein
MAGRGIYRTLPAGAARGILPAANRRMPPPFEDPIMTHLRCTVLSVYLIAAGVAQEPARPPQPPAGEPAPAAQPPRPDAPQVPGDASPQEVARAMAETIRLATPGPEHKRLAALAGDWTVELTLSPPGKEPERSTGRARAATVLGGRWLVVELSVPVQGVAIEGLYMIGFDNLRRLYAASWRDSLSTWSIECLGAQDPKDEKRIALQGLLFDAVSPAGREFRLDFVIEGPDAFAFVVFDTIGDRQARVMEQRFARAAPGERKDGR